MMKLIYNRIFLEHDTGMHPENRKRLESFEQLPESDVSSGESQLELLHDKSYINRVKQVCNKGGYLDHDTITSKGSYLAAIHAVGATLQASETGDFALVRPPGHHAYPGHSSGFCIFNNVAIAAQKLANEGKRVLIFDFDGHLGDGTSKIFYDSDKVLYWSIHQYPAFPGGGTAHEIGEGPGRGYTVNIPLPPGSGDDIFMNAVQTFLPIADQFEPDIVAVSAGFDSHQYDLLLDLRVTASSFYRLGQLLRNRFHQIFATLEGGYNVEYLPRCVHNFLNGMNGEKVYFKEKETPSDMRTLEEYELREGVAIHHLKKFWKI